MGKMPGKLAESIRRLRRNSVADIEQIFGSWVQLPEDFGKEERKRLFSPLKSILAVSISDIFR